MKKELDQISGLDDRQLLKRFFRQSDQEALTEIVNRHRSLVWSVCSRNLTNQADIEDAFQATFLILTQKRHSTIWQKSIAGWLYTVANRTSRRIAKRRQNAPACLEADPTDKSESALDRLERIHATRMVDQALGELADFHKTPLILHYCYGWSARRISDEIGISISAVEGRIRRGRQKLQTCLIRGGVGFGVTSIGALLPQMANSAVTPALVNSTIHLASGSCILEPAIKTIVCQKDIMMFSIIKKSFIVVACLLVFASFAHFASTSDKNSGVEVSSAVSNDESVQSETRFELASAKDLEAHKKEKSHAQHIHEYVHAFFKMLHEHFHG